MANYFSSKLPEPHFKKLFLSTKEAFNEQYYFYEIGPLCNATRPYPFLSADCDLQGKMVPHKEPRSSIGVQSIDFPLLYEKGFDLMKDVFEANTRFEDFDEPSKSALQSLLDFIENKEYNENCLAKALNKEHGDFNETDVAVAISEHLLTKLSPGKSYIIDNHSKNRKGCRCGCKVDVEYSDTGFGNEHVWHGYFDVVLKAHGEAESGVHVRLELGDEESSDEVNPKDDLELNSSLGETHCVRLDIRDAIENQSAAQAMVFSFTQKERHPNIDNYLIPFFAISASRVRIFMYDASNDVLLRSKELSIFDPGTKSTHFKLDTVIHLWMVLHYKHFCTGIHPDLSVNLEDLKSGFLEHIEPCIQYYKASKYCCYDFPPVPEERKLLGDKPDNSITLGMPRPRFCSNFVYIKN